MPKTDSVLFGTERRCQCPSCGEFFSTTRNFDSHRKTAEDGTRFCADPEDVGLVIGRVAGNTFWKGRGKDELLGVWK